ncbi:WhiB family transcriptional regulator [Nocardiopsis alba]
MRDALCRTVADPDAWHPTTETPDAVADAREACMACPVRTDCLSYVLGQRTPLTGVWAATTTRQRRVMRTEANKARRRRALSDAA